MYICIDRADLDTLFAQNCTFRLVKRRDVFNVSISRVYTMLLTYTH